MDEAPHVAVRGVTHDDVVPFDDVAGEGAATEDLEIVGMRPDRQYAHARSLTRVKADGRPLACLRSTVLDSTTSGS